MRAFDPGAVAGKTRGGIDHLDYVDGLPGLVTHPQRNVVPHGAPVLVSGWAVDPRTGGRPLAVCLRLDRARPLDARIGIARGDIVLERGADEFVGYQLTFDTGNLAPGAHELRAYALSTDGFWYESAAADFRLYHYAFPGTARHQRALRMMLQEPIDIAAGIEVVPGSPIRSDRWILLHGWAIDNATRKGAATIAAFDDHGRTWSGPANIERPDVRDALRALDVRLGFEITIPAAVLGRGRHRLQIAGFDEAGRRYANTIENTVDIINAPRPFPLTARVTTTAAPLGARLRAVGSSNEQNDARETAIVQPLPARGPVIVAHDSRVIVDGWALDRDGAPADEVFVELTATWVHLPPQRLPATCAQGQPVRAFISSPPVDDAWFTCTFETGAMQRADYALALVVVQPGRRTCSRVPLATLRIV